MKPVVLFYIFLIKLTLLLGSNRVWHVFFPSTVELKTQDSSVFFPEIPAQFTDVHLADVSVAKLWGIDAGEVAVKTRDFENATWDITLQENTWLLQTKENPDTRWMFYGVIQRSTGMVALFFNEVERFKLVTTGEFFFELKVQQASSSKITLRDPEGNDYILGLFNLKNDIEIETKKSANK